MKATMGARPAIHRTGEQPESGGAPEIGEEHLTGPRKPLILVTTSIVTSLIMLDSNIVSVSLPKIAQSFDARFSEVEWVLSTYVLAFASLLLVTAAWQTYTGAGGP